MLVGAPFAGEIRPVETFLGVEADDTGMTLGGVNRADKTRIKEMTGYHCVRFIIAVLLATAAPIGASPDS